MFSCRKQSRNRLILLSDEDLNPRKKVSNILLKPANSRFLKALESKQALERGSIEFNTVQSANPALQRPKQCQRTMLPFRAFSQLDLFHEFAR